MKTSALLLGASVLALAWFNIAEAQTASTAPDDGSSATIETVVVTAERRNEDLMKSPISATVLTGTDLSNKGVLTVDDLQFHTPSVVINNFGQGMDFNIRGIGKSEHNTQTLTGVITYRDGVATFPGYFTEEPYYDIASIQILRGPQGTFVGQNATGGAVFVASNDPVIGGDYNGYAQAQYGNYNDTQLQGAINIPISDTFAIRIAGFGEARGSFFSITDSDPADNCPNNKYAGCKPGYNPGDTQWAAGRISALWKPNDALTVSFKYDADYLDNGAYPMSNFDENSPTLLPLPGVPPADVGQPNPHYSDIFHITNNYKSVALDRFHRFVLKADYVFPDGIKLQSVTGFQAGTTAWTADLDGGDYGSHVSAGSPKDWYIAEQVGENIWSEEINLISPSTGRLTWVAGAFAQSDIYDFPPGRFTVAIPTNAAPNVVDAAHESILYGKNPESSLAVFGQVTYKLTDNFEAQYGARYSINRTTNDVTWDQYALPYTEKSLVEKSTNYSYKASLNWQLNDDNFLYGFIATGYKPGGINPPIYNLVLPVPFKPETVTSYEAGWKSTMFGGHVRSSFDGYYNNYKGFIVTVGYPGLTFPGFTTEINDPNPTISYGLESEVDAVFGNLSFGFALGLERNTIGQFYAVDGRIGSTGVPCNPTTGPATAQCVNLAGHPMSYAPDFTYNLNAQYVFNLDGGDTLTPRVNFGHQNPQWASLFDNTTWGDKLSARDLLGAQLEWKRASYILTLYGTNLTDQHYEAALISNLRTPGPPRQFGIRLMKVF